MMPLMCLTARMTTAAKEEPRMAQIGADNALAAATLMCFATLPKWLATGQLPTDNGQLLSGRSRAYSVPAGSGGHSPDAART